MRSGLHVRCQQLRAVWGHEAQRQQAPAACRLPGDCAAHVGQQLLQMSQRGTEALVVEEDGAAVQAAAQAVSATWARGGAQ